MKGEVTPGERPSQAAIGRVLGLSPAAMTKLKKQGMPVDSVETAQAWRLARQNVAARKPLPGGNQRHLRHHGPALPPPAADPPDAPGIQPGMLLAPPPPPDDLSPEDRDAARTRREVAEANMAELAEARLRRELINVRAVQDRLALDYATTREALLQLPARMGPLLAAEADPAAVERLLYAEVHAALMHLAGAAEALPHLEGAFD